MSALEEASRVMGFDDSGWGAGQWLAMATMMLLFWGLVIALVVWGMRSLRTPAPGPRSRSVPRSPAEVLAARFAAGEIDEAEFQRRRELLRGAS